MAQTIRTKWFLCALVTLSCIVTPAVAATFYIDPVNGSMTGDGSQGNPWSTLAEVLSGGKIESMKPAAYPYAYNDPLVAFNVGAPVQPGDTLLLLSGDHGEIYIQGYYNTDWIIVRAATGETPVLRRIQIRGGCRWHFDGLTISQEPYGVLGTITAVNFENHGWHGPAHDSIIENCHIYGVDDTSSFTANDWLSSVPSGIASGGVNNIIRYNTIRNVQLAVSVSADDNLIEHNTLIGMAHDGFRSAGDNIIWQYNQLSDFVDVDDNHDDMIQMYRGGGVPHVGVQIRGNYFDGRMISGRALTTSPQGIGCFDGPYVNCVVENNVVLTAHYHGITLNDVDNCKIINNTSIDPSRAYPAWITVPDEVTGSKDSVVRNNLSYAIPSPDPVDNIVVDHNIELTDTLSDQIFVDWRNGDVHLAINSPAIDAGDGTDAPAIDIDGSPRPQGNGWDIGAYESSSTGNIPPVADAGPDQNVTDSDDDGSEDVTLNGSASSDSDGSIVSYVWEENSSQIATGVGPTVTLNIGVHNIDLTVTDDGGATNGDSVVVNVDPAAGGQTSSTTWQTFPLGSSETGVFTAEFDARPNNDSMDGVTGICLGTASTWGDLACIFRFNTSGTMDVRNGGAYAADTTMAYSATTRYHVRMVIDVPSDTYSVYVTPEGSSETALATGYAFRTEQTGVGSLDSWAIHSLVGTHTVSNMTIGGAQNQPPVADAGPDQNVTDSNDNGSEDVTLDGSASSDSDGTIASYVWEENSSQIATGVSPTVSLSVAVHTIDLIVTDDDSDTDSDSVVITVSAPADNGVLFVAGSATLTTADQVVADLLTTAGYTVTVMDDAVATAADATGKTLVVVSATVNGNTVGAEFRTVAVPVLTWEKDIMDDMDMTTDQNVERKQTQVDIVDSSHDMAAGLSGTVSVYSDNEYVTWGSVTAEADVVASVAGNSSKATIFGYETSVVMANSYAAPARRVGVFLDANSAEVLTVDGNSLIDAALSWALGL